MKTIWKFPLGYDGDTRFEVIAPEGAEPLRVDFDPRGELVAWALVDPGAAPRSVIVTVVGTGHPVPEDAGRYVSTLFSDPFVFHAFWAQP